MPPAFALSQDQTLKFIRSNASSTAPPRRSTAPSPSELRHHSLLLYSQVSDLFGPARSLLSTRPSVPSPGPPAANHSRSIPTAHHTKRQPRIPAPEHQPHDHPWPLDRIPAQAARQLTPTHSPIAPPQISPSIPSPAQPCPHKPCHTRSNKPGLSPVKPLFICQGAPPQDKKPPQGHLLPRKLPIQ